MFLQKTKRLVFAKTTERVVVRVVFAKDQEGGLCKNDREGGREGGLGRLRCNQGGPKGPILNEGRS